MKKKRSLKRRIMGLACTIIGLAIATIGMRIATEKQYAGGTIPNKE